MTHLLRRTWLARSLPLIGRRNQRMCSWLTDLLRWFAVLLLWFSTAVQGPSATAKVAVTMLELKSLRESNIRNIRAVRFQDTEELAIHTAVPLRCRASEVALAFNTVEKQRSLKILLLKSAYGLLECLETLESSVKRLLFWNRVKIQISETTKCKVPLHCS